MRKGWVVAGFGFFLSSFACRGNDVRQESPTGFGASAVEEYTLRVVADAPVASKDNTAPNPQETVVTLGVPLRPGLLDDPELVQLWLGDTEVPLFVRPLALWPVDRSLRSIFLGFRTKLAPRAEAQYRLVIGERRTQSTPAVAPNPDGPLVALLEPKTYATSQALGPQLPADANRRFDTWERAVEENFATMAPPYAQYGVDCQKTSEKRTYYDGPHSLFQRFVRYGDPLKYRQARAESQWYRRNELRWLDGKSLAVQVCQPPDWNPSKPLEWVVLRTMIGQGQLDDYLLTGDTKAFEALAAMGNTFRQSLPVLLSGEHPALDATERNMAWVLMGLVSAYAASNDSKLLEAAKAVVDRAIAWSERSPSGAFEHDVNLPDPSECEDGPAGASPFMTSLLVDGLMDYYELTKDARIPKTVLKVARWYRTQALTSDGKAFRYLWGCRSDPYDDSYVSDLNVLIVHVFGAAYRFSGDGSWLDFADALADEGIDTMKVDKPKQWNQATRSFSKYLGYRATGRQP